MEEEQTKYRKSDCDEFFVEVKMVRTNVARRVDIAVLCCALLL